MKFERWIDQNDTSVGHRQNLSHWQKSNPWAPEHRAGALFTELRELLESTIFIYLSPLTLTSTVLILAICRTPVTYELSLMTLLSMRSRSSVDRAPARCSEVMGSWRGILFFFVLSSRHVDQLTFHISTKKVISLLSEETWDIIEIVMLTLFRLVIFIQACYTPICMPYGLHVIWTCALIAIFRLSQAQMCARFQLGA